MNRAFTDDQRTIKEAWGEGADISDCFTNSVHVGVDNTHGQSRSDISLLVDTDKMSFAHRVTTVRICELPPAAQSSKSLIQSIHFWLGKDGVDDIELDVMGLEYGVCTTQKINGEFKFMEILYLPKRGVHKIKIVDSTDTYDFGPALTAETAQLLERTAVTFNDEEERVVGLQATWKYNGI